MLIWSFAGSHSRSSTGRTSGSQRPTSRPPTCATATRQSRAWPKSTGPRSSASSQTAQPRSCAPRPAQPRSTKSASATHRSTRSSFGGASFPLAPSQPFSLRKCCRTLQNYVLDHRFGVTVLSVFDAFRTSPCFAGTPLDPKFANDIISLSRPINGTQYLHSTAGHLLECVVVLGLRPLADPPLGAGNISSCPSSLARY